MKFYKIVFMMVILIVCFSSLILADGFLATKNNIELLKEDLLAEHLQVNQTRLRFIRKYYGDAPEITEDDEEIVYEYPGLKIEFNKKRILVSWEYDTFKDPVYTDDVDDLREDLESQEIAGNNISYAYIVKEYGEPTDLIETENDGMHSIYYYGDIKLIFENIIKMKKYQIEGYEKEIKGEKILATKPIPFNKKQQADDLDLNPEDDLGQEQGVDRE
jgi:hypothetical protein